MMETVANAKIIEDTRIVYEHKEEVAQLIEEFATNYLKV